jgi:hypothetical protein
VGKPLAPGTAARIFTGAPIPPGADAIVMQEFCAVEGEAVVVRKVPKPANGSASPEATCARATRSCRRQAPAAAGHRARRIGRHRDGAGLPACAAGPLLHGRRAGDAGRAARAGQDLQLESLHAERHGARIRLRRPRLRIVPDSLEATRAMLRRRRQSAT